jgi:hypothetical protein
VPGMKSEAGGPVIRIEIRSKKLCPVHHSFIVMSGSSNQAAGQAAAAWNSLVAAVNEYGALLTEESIWGGINRLLLCTDVGLVSAQIAEYTGILSPNGAHIEEVTSIFSCGVGLEFVVRR